MGAGLEASDVVDPVLTHNGFSHQTLDIEVQDVDCEEVVIGDVDHVLLGGKQGTYQLQTTL